LGSTVSKRRISYKAFVEDGVAAKEQQAFIQMAAERNQLTGGSRFVEEVELRTGVRINHRGRGRPKKYEGDRK